MERSKLVVSDGAGAMQRLRVAAEASNDVCQKRSQHIYAQNCTDAPGLQNLETKEVYPGISRDAQQ